MKRIKLYRFFFPVTLATLLGTAATGTTLHPVDEDFVGQMAEYGISQAEWDIPEFSSVALPHAYKFMRYYEISRGSAVAPQKWPDGEALDLGRLKGMDGDGEHDLVTLLRDRLLNHSMVILKNGKLVHQHFFDGMNEQSTHLDMSVTKSFTSILAGIAASEGKLDMSKPVEYYLPQFKKTSFVGVTVQEVADMRSGLAIPTPPHKSWDPRFTESQEWNGPNDSGLHGIKDYLQLIKGRKYQPGEVYQYQDPNTEILGMITEKATGQRLADLLETKIWQRVGAEHDAYWMADPDGFVVASGGLNMTTRDLARIGLVMLNDGKNYLGEPVIPKQFIDALWEGNDAVRSAWKKNKKEGVLIPDAWYKDQFRVLNVGGHKVLCMVGIYGQVLAMEKSSGTVIAMNSGYTQTETPRMVNLAFYQVIPAILDALK